MHHRVKEVANAMVSGLPFTYSLVSSGVHSAIRIATANNMVMASVMSLLSLVSASFAFNVRTICGTSTALKIPPETRV